MTVKEICKTISTIIGTISILSGIAYGMFKFVDEAKSCPQDVQNFKGEFNKFKKDMEAEHREFRQGIAENKQDSQVNRAILLEVREGVRTIQQALVQKGVK